MNRLRVLFRFKGLLQEEVKLKIVKAVVFPVIVYALPVFGGRLALEGTVLIDRLQNSAPVSPYSKDSSDKVNFQTSGGLPCSQGVADGKTLLPQGMLQTRAEIRDCHTRQDAMLEVPRVRLEMGRNGFRYFGPQIYNSVPHSLKAHGYFRQQSQTGFGGGVFHP
ncbi:hypothetical protein J6590_046360 [Homalodisca vitripennis]|nr:hypothetical protein J6590_046360 [Homalodisca vitripennis]